jgi:hypothetical protein
MACFNDWLSVTGEAAKPGTGLPNKGSFYCMEHLVIFVERASDFCAIGSVRYANVVKRFS